MNGLWEIGKTILMFRFINHSYNFFAVISLVDSRIFSVRKFLLFKTFEKENYYLCKHSKNLLIFPRFLHQQVFFCSLLYTKECFTHKFKLSIYFIHLMKNIIYLVYSGLFMRKGDIFMCSIKNPLDFFALWCTKNVIKLQ